MPPLDSKSREKIMKIVQDPRYDQQKMIDGLAPAAELKLALVAGGLVAKLNRAYGWNLPQSGDWSVEQSNDVIYEIVTKPGYSIKRLVAAIRSGRRL